MDTERLKNTATLPLNSPWWSGPGCPEVKWSLSKLFSVICTWSFQFGPYPEARSTFLRANILQSFCSSRTSQVLTIWDKMFNFLHLALRLSLIQTTLPAFSPFRPISKLPLLIKSHPAFLSPQHYPGLDGLPVPFSHHQPESCSPSRYRALPGHSSLAISLTQSSLYVLSIEHSHVWFFIISNVLVCSHLIGITGLLAAWEQRLYIVFPRTPHGAFLMAASLKCS